MLVYRESSSSQCIHHPKLCRAGRPCKHRPDLTLALASRYFSPLPPPVGKARVGDCPCCGAPCTYVFSCVRNMRHAAVWKCINRCVELCANTCVLSCSRHDNCSGSLVIGALWSCARACVLCACRGRAWPRIPTLGDKSLCNPRPLPATSRRQRFLLSCGI